MGTLLKRLQLGIGAGAALALGGAAGLSGVSGCAKAFEREPDVSDANTPDPDARIAESDAHVTSDSAVTQTMDATSPWPPWPTDDASTTADANAAPDATQELPQIPPELFNCTDGDAGWCCYTRDCVAVEGTCPEVDSPSRPITYPVPAQLAHCASYGPFAPPPGEVDFLGEPVGNCCYVVPGALIGEGRPVFHEGTALAAPVIERSDWLLG